MKLWVDAQLSPATARWLRDSFGVEASALREVGLRDAGDAEIFTAARQHGAVVMTKDEDFAELVLRNGAPPQVIWIRCGNTSNSRLQEILSRQWATVAALLSTGEALVEVVERR